LLQAFGVVVVNEALGLGDGPFESGSQALADEEGKRVTGRGMTRSARKFRAQAKVPAPC